MKKTALLITCCIVMLCLEAPAMATTDSSITVLCNNNVTVVREGDFGYQRLNGILQNFYAAPDSKKKTVQKKFDVAVESICSKETGRFSLAIMLRKLIVKE